MMPFLKVCFSGLLISFLGALPFGTLNLTAFDITASQGMMPAIWFALAVVLVELIVVRLTLVGSEKIHLSDRALFYLLPLGALLLLYLSITSFMDIQSATLVTSNSFVLPGIKSTFLLGLLLSGLNPLQVPFWLTWNKVLESKGVLARSNAHYSFYLIGIGMGTLMGLSVFIWAGELVFANYNQYSAITNLLMGILYLGFSCYLLYLFIKKRLTYKIQ